MSRKTDKEGRQRVGKLNEIFVFTSVCCVRLLVVHFSLLEGGLQK